MEKVTEAHIRKAFAHGRRDLTTGDLNICYYTPVLKAAYMLGADERASLGAVVDGVRYGSVPTCGLSQNHADQTSEYGLSVISAGDDCDGSAGAHMFMSDRKRVTVRGVLIEGRRGSDGEPLLLPVDICDHLD